MTLSIKQPPYWANVTTEHECPENDIDEEINPQKENEIDILKQKIESMETEIESKEKEAEEAKKGLERRLHQALRNGDLAKNKISTATECLDMFLVDNLKSKEFDEFDSSFKFLVTQYSSLLCTPDYYTVNTENLMWLSLIHYSET